MNAVKLNQTKPQQTTLSGYVLLVLTPVLWYFNENTLTKVGIFFIIGLVLIGYTVTYEIRNNFENFKIISLFGFPVWRQRLTLFKPEYISVFSASFKKDNEWGAVAAIGGETKIKNVVVKFFEGRKNEIVFKSNDYTEALEKATELGLLLNVRVHDAIKNSST